MVHEGNRVRVSEEILDTRLGEVDIYSRISITTVKEKNPSDLWETKKGYGESAWEYNQIFKHAIGKLANPIHGDHKRKWFIHILLPLTCIPLTQQRIITLREALEKDMKIEAMEFYLGSLRIMKPP
jgi:hypothetical protein